VPRQGVAHEVLALEVLIQMLESPSEDSVEVAVEFVKEVGAYLKEVVPQGLHRWAGGRGGRGAGHEAWGWAGWTGRRRWLQAARGLIHPMPWRHQMRRAAGPAQGPLASPPAAHGALASAAHGQEADAPAALLRTAHGPGAGGGPRRPPPTHPARPGPP
jgi:hypothetical protein